MKGQSLRICEEDNKRRVEGETSCELHISIETESEVNKDSYGNWDYPVFVGYSFNTTIDMQIISFTKQEQGVMHATNFSVGDTEVLHLAKFDGNTYMSSVCHGNLICTSVSYKSDNKKTITATIKHEGNGELEFDE